MGIIIIHAWTANTGVRSPLSPERWNDLSPSRSTPLPHGILQRKLENPSPCGHFARVEAKEANLSFETALTRLETVVESMESGEVPLAELLSKFEQGNKLLKLCEVRLKEAELKIEQLKKQKDGVTFVPFETDRDS